VKHGELENKNQNEYLFWQLNIVEAPVLSLRVKINLWFIRIQSFIKPLLVLSIVPYASFLFAIIKCHLTFSMLLASFPRTFIDFIFFFPIISTLSIFLVELIVSIIPIPIWPCEQTASMHLVILILTVVGSAFRELIFSISIDLTFWPPPIKLVAFIMPHDFSFAMPLWCLVEWTFVRALLASNHIFLNSVW